MSYTDALAQISQIQSQITALTTAFTPPAASPTASSTATTTPATSFADQLAMAQAPAQTDMTSMTDAPSGVTSGLLTSGQQQFASQLAADTGLSPQVVGAWVLAEESGGAATARQGAGNNDWLNIGYTDGGTYGSADSVWSNPTTAANATAGWLQGQNTIPGYGAASSGIQAILGTAGQPPATQVAAIQQSGWASSGYPDLPALYSQIAT
jgi:hypothetical protein